MTLSEFICSRQHQDYLGYYFNYDLLLASLNNLTDLEKEKAYGFNFTIVEQEERYKVIPAISNDDFKDSYEQFLKVLSCEIDRVDLLLDEKLNQLYRKVDEVRIELLTHHDAVSSKSYLNWFGFTKPAPIASGTKQLHQIETELNVLLKSVVPLNKFALSKLLDFKRQFVLNSNYHHLLLEVELGYQIQPRPKFFPKAGKNNRYNFYSTDSEHSDIVVTPSDDPIPSINLPFSDRMNPAKSNPDFKDSGANMLLSSNNYLNLPTNCAISHRNPSSSSNSSIHSGSNLSTNSNLSTASNYSKNSLCSNTLLFTTTSRRIKSLLSLVKSLKFKFTSTHAKIQAVGFV